MSGDPQECRAHAKACAALAASAPSPIARDSFLMLAETWSRLANELEVTKRLVETWGADSTVTPLRRTKRAG
jgi:hypothetical protein